MSRHYCTLFLRANDRSGAAALLKAAALGLADFTDERSPARLASAERMRAAGFMFRNDLPRFTWHLDTRERVDLAHSDVTVHVRWLLDQLKPGVKLGDAAALGVESQLGFYWGGNGTGGGPYLTPELSELLLAHKATLHIGFYYEEPEDQSAGEA